MSKERRRAERFKSNLFVRIESNSTGNGFLRGVVVDVSHSGFAIETEGDLAMLDDCKCYVEIPFPMKARVVRRSASGQVKRYGLAIIGQNFLDKLTLKRLLKGLKATSKV